MQTIIIEQTPSDQILLKDVPHETPIFARKVGSDNPCGMIVRERAAGDQWILRIGGDRGATGHHSSLEECLKSCLEYGQGYEFFIY